MKPSNNAERKVHRLKFIGMYSASVVLIIIVLSAFLQPVPAAKTIMVEKEKPARIIIKTIYVTQKKQAENNNHERDSLIAAISFNQKKVDELNAYIQSQKNIITQLQNQPATTNKPVANSNLDKNQLAKLKKQIQFYDWALRSQVAVTNTLTKENNALKDKIAQLGKSR